MERGLAAWFSAPLETVRLWRSAKAKAPMTENGSAAPTATPPQPNAAPPQMSVLLQYLKDISFENIAAETGKNPTAKPQINVQVNVENRKLAESRYAVHFSAEIDAKSGEDDVFSIDLIYVGVFELKNVPDAALGAVLAVECPRMLFPFARRILADVTRDGGYPPLLLDPIDFGALYRQQLLRRASETKEPQAEGSA